jgi:hypothetical protein
LADEPINDGDSAAAKSVAAEIANSHRRETVTNEQRLIWQLEFEAREEERRQRVREARIENHRAEIEAAARAERQARQAAIADAEARQRAGREAMERSQRNRETAGIYERLTRAEQFRNHAVAHARQQAAINQRQALLDDLQRDIDNLKPPPPPTVVVEQPEEDPPWRLGPGFDPKARRW